MMEQICTNFMGALAGLVINLGGHNLYHILEIFDEVIFEIP